MTRFFEWVKLILRSERRVRVLVAATCWSILGGDASDTPWPGDVRHHHRPPRFDVVLRRRERDGVSARSVRDVVRGHGPACGWATSAPTTYQHVIWIMFEDNVLSSVIGNAAAPYITNLAKT